MSIRYPERATEESVADRVLALALALETRGDAAVAESLLERIAPADPDPRVALWRGELALRRGDAAAALAVLAPAWDGGATDPQIESSLALAALALGLDEIVGAMTEAPRRSLTHDAIRLVLAAQRGESLDVDLGVSPTEAVWCLRSVARTLAECGRGDAVDALRRADLPIEGLAAALATVPSEPPVAPVCARLPLGDARAEFDAAWPGPAGHGAFSWAWAVARDVRPLERVVLAGPTARAFSPLLAHARLVSAAADAGTDATVIADPTRLPVRPGRFQHAIGVAWIEATFEPQAAMRELWRPLEHGGLLHLLCVGPAAPGDYDLRFTPDALWRLCERTGFAIDSIRPRRADGTPAEGADAVFHFVRARKTVI